MKKFILILFAALCALPVFAQQIPGAPGYQLPVTVVTQKWYGTGAPTAANGFPAQPGDLYFDTTTPAVYWCSAPVTKTISLFGGPPACSAVASGQWVLISGSFGSTGVLVSMTAGTGGTTAGELVKIAAATVVKTLTTDTAPDVAFGIAQTTVAGTANVQVAIAGTSSCIADTGGITAGNLVGAGTTVAATCVDLGQTAVASVAPNIAVIGRALTTALATVSSTILLFPQTGAGYAATGTGNYVRATSPTLVTPLLGTPTSGVMTNLTGTPSGAGVTLSVVLPLTLTQLQTLYSVGLQILPAPGATSMYEMGSCTLNLTHGSAAFTGGGSVSIGYGATFAATTPSPVTNGTIAATVFTTFTGSQAVVVLPIAVPVTATTSLANKPVFMSAATQDFASGTGGSGQVSCQYNIVTGVS